MRCIASSPLTHRAPPSEGGQRRALVDTALAK